MCSQYIFEVEVLSRFFEVPNTVWLSRSVKGAIKLFTVLEPGLDYSNQKLSHYLTVSSSHFCITELNRKFLRIATNILFCAWTVSAWSTVKAVHYKSVLPQEEKFFSNAILRYLL